MRRRTAALLALPILPAAALAALGWPRHRPAARAPTGDPACTVCVFQRDGDLAHIGRHLTGIAQPEGSGGFGHCFACVSCEGDAAPTCAGWWADDPDSAGLLPEPGHIRDDAEERWEQAACVFVTAAEGQAIRDATAAYAANAWQALDVGGRSCLGYCDEVAAHLDLGVRWPAGHLTVPGALEIDGAELTATPDDGERPARFMYGVHPAWAPWLRQGVTPER